MDPCPARPKAPSFLSDLGKATLRGIRKCPRCGTYNGTRGLSCKNKTCGTVFRAGTRRQPGADAVRVLTGSHSQLYSVRQRDSRCFVELGVSETAIQTPEGTLITQLSSGRCHAPACAKAAADKQCQHLKLALGCQAEATPLPLKSSVLGAVQAPAEAKQSLWELATEPTGPLVQRVTKSVLVVKCKASQRHSLGYLHASFGQRRFSCACCAPGHGPGKGKDEEEEDEEEESPPPRCIHFLACICAFASDESLAQEFSDFLASDAGGGSGQGSGGVLGLGSPQTPAWVLPAAPPRFPGGASHHRGLGLCPAPSLGRDSRWDAAGSGGSRVGGSAGSWGADPAGLGVL